MTCPLGRECRPVVECPGQEPYPVCLRCAVGRRAIVWAPDLDFLIDREE